MDCDGYINGEVEGSTHVWRKPSRLSRNARETQMAEKFRASNSQKPTTILNSTGAHSIQERVGVSAKLRWECCCHESETHHLDIYILISQVYKD